MIIVLVSAQLHGAIDKIVKWIKNWELNLMSESLAKSEVRFQ